MNCNVIPSKKFLRDVKKLGKKYINIDSDIDNLVKSLEITPLQGIQITEHIYKIRLKSSDISKGKSGGFRVIYYIVTDEKEVYLLAIYTKMIMICPKYCIETLCQKGNVLSF